ncbi:MAG: peptide deformylase [Deltaproteobacteria bacterium]|nr:peptide deformylase [Deltaproteobacteria bacterium]
MARLVLRTYPDSVLREECAEVTVFDEKLARLAADMLETMYTNDGVGLAAPQVGVSRRLIVIDAASGEERGKSPLVLVNPKIIESDGIVEWDEGCLSLPELSVIMQRKATVVVQALSPAGEPFELRCEGLLAVAIQHEIDHLEGKLLLDYLPPLKRRMVARDFRKKKERELEV